MIIESIMYCDNCRRELTKSEEANIHWEAKQYDMPIEHFCHMCPACNREFMCPTCNREFMRNHQYYYELENEGPAL